MKGSYIVIYIVIALTEHKTDEHDRALGREKELQSQIGEAHLRAIESIGATFQKIGRVPAVKATLSVDKVRNLAGNGAIGRIDYVDKDFRTDLVTSLNISRTDTMKSHINLDGSGVKAAIYESGTNDLTDLKFEGRYTGAYFHHVPSTKTNTHLAAKKVQRVRRPFGIHD